MALSFLLASPSSGASDGPGGRSPQPQPPSDRDDAAERLGFFLVRSPVGTLVLNPRAEIVDCNPAALNLLGLTREQVIGRSWLDIGADAVQEDGAPFPRETGPVLQAINERRMVGGVVMGVARPRRGDRVWLEIHAHPRLSQMGDVRELVLLFRDITERRLRQAAERRAEEAERDRDEAEHQRGEASLEYALPGVSSAIIALHEEVEEAARTLDDLPVLILGEPGTGKTLVAQTLHSLSSRSGGRFEPVNCAGISASLFESEVFGHEKGAFTGAVASRPGRFELAHGGTLFLDEVGDLPLEQQAKLLVALQERSVRRIGGKADIAVDIAVVAATNHDLARMVAEGTFRPDLYDRLNGFTIRVPPLRKRGADIQLLLHRFVQTAARRARKTIHAVDQDVVAAFQRYDWPGNVRQLDFVVRRMVARVRGERITMDVVPDEVLAPSPLKASDVERLEVPSKERIEIALAACDGNVRRTAEQLGISRARLYRLMEKHDLKRPG